MAGDNAQRFMQAIQEAEDTHEVRPIVQLFGPEADLENPARSIVQHGPEGTRQFWQDYLSAFEQMHSEFTRVLEGQDFAVLEWKTDGRLPTGKPISYRGTSVVEFEGDQVRRFCTYYDSATFLPEGAKQSAENVRVS